MILRFSRVSFPFPSGVSRFLFAAVLRCLEQGLFDACRRGILAFKSRGEQIVGVVIPRITLRADYGEENSFGELSLLCIGYGLHQAWVFSTMFSPQRIFGVSAIPVSDFLGSSVSISPMMATSVVVYALFLMFAGATDQRYLNFYTSRRFSVIGAALMVVGTLAALLSGSVLLEILAGVLTGLGSAALILSWGIAFARCDGLSIVLDTAVATLFAMALYAFVVHNAPAGVAGFVVAVLPLLELAVLRCKLPAPFYERGELPAFNPLPVKRGRFLLAFCVPVALLGFALGALRSASLQAIVPSVTLGSEFAILLASACAAFLVLASALSLDDDAPWTGLFRIIVPVVALALLFLPQTFFGEITLGSFIVLTAYLCFEALMWSYFGVLSQQFRLSPLFVFGFGRGVLALLVFAGMCAPLLFEQVYFVDSSQGASVSAVVLMLVVVGHAMLPSERGMQKLIVSCPLVNAAAAGAFDAPGVAAVLEGAAGDSSSDGKEKEDASSDEAVSSGSSKRWFKENCEVIANRYLLSRRETDVLFLLAKGYNSAAIQEKLYIAEGTAKTHIRHIYRKLDVHTQQELMRMVEGADR